MKKVLVIGENSFIASHLPYEKLPGRLLASESIIETMLVEHSPDVVINCAAFTGTIGTYKNIDGCEIYKGKTVATNLTLPTLLATTLEKHNVKLIQIGSGCIFYGESPNHDRHWANKPENKGKILSIDNMIDHGWKEDDFAHPLSFYSKVKYACDLAIGSMPNVLIPRIRMPNSNKNNPRNLINKLIGYTDIIDIPNSVTFIDDLVRFIDWAIENDKSGIYNVVNPEPMTHVELLEEYRKYHPEHSYHKINEEELSALVSAPRSNCLLDGSKLRNEGFEITKTKDALEKTMKEYCGI